MSQKKDGRINRLLLRNFKSYGGTTEIGPFASFTGIVGPNGSGKSNLLDAISFVLGVSSRYLRASKLADFIYAGGDTVPDSASVSLFLIKSDKKRPRDDDHDVGELEFSRMIKADGKSIYSVAGKHVSYEQYLEELKSFDVVVKARNFLVFQGDVEQVAQKDPKDLAKMVEEVSGSEGLIQDFEKFKDEAEAASSAFRRLGLKQQQMESQRRELEKQVDEVREVESKKAQIANIELERTLFKHHVSATRHQRMEEEIDSRRKALAVAYEKRDELKMRVKEFDAARAKAKKELEEHSKRTKEVTSRKTKTMVAMQKEEEKVRMIKKSIDTAASAKRDIQAKLKDIEDSIQLHNDKYKTCESQIQEFTKTIKALSKPLLNEKQFIEYTALEAQAETHSGALVRTLEDRKREVEMSKDKLHLVENERDRAAQMLASAESRLGDLGREYVSQQNVVENQRTVLDAAKAKMTHHHETAQQLTADRQRLEKGIAEIEEELKHHAAMRNENARQQEKLRNTRELKDAVNGVYGLLSEECEPIKQDFGVALSTALGKYADHVIIDTFNHAKEAADFTKHRRFKTTTFVPLDNIDGGRSDPWLLSMEKADYPKLAIDCIAFKPELRPAYEMALKDTLIVRSLGEAQEIQEKCLRSNKRVKIVTLEGERFQKNGNISVDAGSQKKNVFDGKDRRAAEERLEALRTEYKEFQKSQATALSAALESQQLERLQRQYDTQLGRLNVYAESVEDLKAKVEALRRQCDTSEVEHLTALLETAKASLVEAEEELSTMDKKVFGAFSKKVGSPDIRKAMRHRKDEAVEAEDGLNALQIQAIKLQGEVKSLTKRGDDVRGSLKSLDPKEKEKELKKAEATFQSLQKVAAEAEEEWRSQGERRSELEKSVQISNSEVVHAQREYRKRETTITEMETELQHQTANLEVSTTEGMTLLRNAVLEGVVIPLSRGTQEDLRGLLGLEASQAEELEIDMSKLSVKGRAVDVMDDSACRVYENKLLESKSTLEESIRNKNPNYKAQDKLDEILHTEEELSVESKAARTEKLECERRFNNTKKKRANMFNACFDSVSESVKKIYSFMTATQDLVGGTASMSLDNPSTDEPFTSGVKYEVMVAGKRYRQTSQLSGGEKTMAALALLFAFQSFRASPFLILDEVDAALDPDNLRALTKMLKDATYQVVVVSLKEKLYSQVDVMFGVYRNHIEKRSGVLSLSLSEYRKASKQTDENRASLESAFD